VGRRERPWRSNSPHKSRCRGTFRKMGFGGGDLATLVECHRHPEAGGEARAPLKLRRSCLHRAQARRARLIRLACCSLLFIPEFSPPRPPRSPVCVRTRTGRQRIASPLHFRGASGPKFSGALFSVVQGQCFETWQFLCVLCALCGWTATFGFILHSKFRTPRLYDSLFP